MKYHTIHLTSSKQIHSTNILALSLVEQAASHLAFLTSSKPLPVLARCGQAGKPPLVALNLRMRKQARLIRTL